MLPGFFLFCSCTRLLYLPQANWYLFNEEKMMMNQEGEKEKMSIGDFVIFIGLFLSPRTMSHSPLELRSDSPG
jgi:hypothetical protein